MGKLREMLPGCVIMLAVPLRVGAGGWGVLRWGGPGRRAAANRARAGGLALGMSARQVRDVMGHAGTSWKQMPAPVWSYPTDNS
jgi:hypothetical protein